MKGQRLLFFSGGTALRELSREMSRQALDSIHIVTTFDSGGSSAALRKAFGIPAVGDLRNRLLALADLSVVPPAVLQICRLRLAQDHSAKEQLLAFADHRHSAWRLMPQEYARELRQGLIVFIRRMNAHFDAAGACIGNLLLAGSYLEHHRDFGPALTVFARMVHAHGIVLPVVNASLHLGAILENNEIIIGQHLFKSLPAPVRELFLTVHDPWTKNSANSSWETTACLPQLLPEARAYLHSANAICYPMGSFYSSLLANLLPAGAGRTIAQSNAAKIFIPNTDADPESRNLGLAAQAEAILSLLHRDAPDVPDSALLQYMLVDSKNGAYPGGCDQMVLQRLADLGIIVVDRPVVAPDRHTHDPKATLQAIMEISENNKTHELSH